MKKFSFLLRGIRYPDIIILSAFPFMGIIFSQSPTFSILSLINSNFFLFLVFIFLILAHVFLLNDWADTLISKEEIAKRKFHFLKCNAFPLPEIIFIISFPAIIALLGFYFYFEHLFLYILLIELITFFYSLPLVRFKGLPVMSTFSHFLFAILFFLAGWEYSAVLSPSAFFLAIYFGLVLSAGHLFNELEDFETDQVVGVLTNAHYFGKTRSFYFAILLFLFSSIYFIFITYLFSYGTAYYVLGILLVLSSILIFFLNKNWQETKTIKKYRNFYRTQYLFFCLLVVLIKTYSF